MRIILVSVFYILCYSKILAQDFQHLTVESGLSNSTVYSVRQYYKGMMWFSTKLGIDRFDGTSFKHYNLYAKGNLLNFGHRQSKLHTDRHDRLWVTNIQDVFCYDKKKDIFEPVLSLTEDYSIRDFYVIDSVTILLATNKGLIKYNTARKSLHSYKDLDHQILRIAKYDENLLLLAASDSIVAFDYKRSAIRRNVFYGSLGGGKNISALAVDSKKNVFVGYDGKVFVFRNTQSQAITSAHLNGLFNNSAIRKILPDSEDQIYIGTDGAGVYIIDQELSVKSTITADQDNPKAIPDNSISDVVIDDDNRIWLSGMGISYYDPNKTPFKLYHHVPNDQNSLIYNSVKAIAEEANGNLWIGTNQGISVFDRKHQQWEHITQSSMPNQLPSNKILDIISIPTRGMAVGTYQKGLVLYKKDGIERLSIDKSVYSIRADSNNVWIGSATGNSGLEKIDLTTGKSISYPLSYIFAITKHPDEGILVGGHEGFFIINPKGQVKRYESSEYQTGSIFDILVDQRKRIWCASEGQGLLLFDTEKQNFKKYTVRDGLPSNMLYGLLEDKLGRIWISTTNGLSCFDPNKEKFFNYSGAGYHGIKEFNYSARVLLSTGEMAFGGRNGFVLFKPEDIIPKNIKTQLVFTDLKLFNKSIRVGDSLAPVSKTIDLTDTLVLDYAQNALSLDFISVAITHPSETRYSWKLEGLDQEWTPPGTERTASYTNLKPGEYIFRVKSLSNNNREVTAERTMSILILPPVWMTGWAYLLYFSLGVLIIYFIVRFYNIRVNEVHSRDKIRFFINIAHDIRTPLSLIISPITLALKRNDFSTDTRHALETANHNSKRLSETITQLLDFEKVALNKIELNLVPIHVEKVLDELCRNFVPSMEEKDISFTRDFRHNKTTFCLDRDKFEKIISNLLSNAVKYTDVGGSISVTTSTKNSNFIVKVSDTGIGIPKEQQASIFQHYFRASNAVNSNEIGSGIGLLLTKKLIEFHKGNISFESESEKGSVFSVSFPMTLTCSGSEHKETHQGDAPVESVSAAVKQKKPTLLIAEDHKELLKHLVDNLNSDYHVYSAFNGRKALDLTKKVYPDIIVSDVMMPEMNGNQLCYELKNHIETSHIPVILLTSLTSDEHKIDGIKTGADLYMEKPFHLDLLKTSIENLLRNRERLKNKFLRKENIADIDGLHELDRAFIEKATRIIEQNLSNPDFSIDVFEREIGMSHAGLYRKFKTVMGKTPLDFIQEVRLKKAVKMLSSGKYQVNEVAYSVGYSDPKYFSTVFKKYFGGNASDYVRRN